MQVEVINIELPPATPPIVGAAGSNQYNKALYRTNKRAAGYETEPYPNASYTVEYNAPLFLVATGAKRNKYDTVISGKWKTMWINGTDTYKTTGQEVAKVNGSCSVFSGPAISEDGASSNYERVGGVSNESVVVLARDQNGMYSPKVSYIEFMTPKGWKRGYIRSSMVASSVTRALPTGRKTSSGVQELREYMVNRYVTGKKIPLQRSPYAGAESFTAASITPRFTVLTDPTASSSYYYIEYNKDEMSGACGRGYLSGSALTQLVTPKVQYSTGVTGSNFRKQYGTSALGRPLYSYQFGPANAKKVLGLVFAQHGYEDGWPADGEVLTRVSANLVDYLHKLFYANPNPYQRDMANKWRVHIAACANPDGILNGYTHQGEGRRTCGVAPRDMNRSWKTSTQFSSRRNFNTNRTVGKGNLSRADDQELYALNEELKRWYKNDPNVKVTDCFFLDVHGWYGKIYKPFGPSPVVASRYEFKDKNAVYQNGQWRENNAHFIYRIKDQFDTSSETAISIERDNKPSSQIEYYGQTLCNNCAPNATNCLGTLLELKVPPYPCDGKKLSEKMNSAVYSILSGY